MSDKKIMKNMSETIKLTPIAAAVAAMLFAGAASAQQASAADEQKADDKSSTTVIVTGTRTAKAVDKIPGAVNVISSAEVARSLAISEDATAVLARVVPGYAEATQAMSNTGETLRGRIPLRLFDGIPQSSPLRETQRSGSFTDLGVVGRIEVINGPSASEGVGAAGGIINYVSKTPTKMGTEVTVTSKLSSQFEDDSMAWKVGANVAHKEEAYDLLFATSEVDRGVQYDAHGRRIGMNASGSLNDTEGRNLFLKAGFNLSTSQRVELQASRFKLNGKGNYVYQEGNRATGLTDTAVPGKPFNGQAEFNDFRQYAANYTNDDILGGTFTAQAYKAQQAMRFVAEKGGADKQDPLIAPLGTLVDQSEVFSKKRGLRTGYTRPDFLTSGLELRAGVDMVRDQTEQRLALTNRTWVPPMVYTSTAPFGQLSYDIGNVTLSGGYRRESGELEVNSYTTTYFNNRVNVEGGSLDYEANLPNAGAVWRFAPGWSTYVSYGKGFALPNVGIPLRNIKVPGQSVKGILDLQAIIVKNKEIGANWKGKMGSLAASYYQSDSDFGVSLSIDPKTGDFIMQRAPVRVKGYEIAGEYNVTRDLRLNGAFAHIRGVTASRLGGPLDTEQGIATIGPDKLTTGVNWQWSERGNVRLDSTTFKGRETNPGKSSREKTGGYTLFDLTSSYKTRYGDLTLAVENLADRYYILTWAQVPGFQNYFAGRGRTISLTHSITF
ncbi:TonB-dependent receptor [Massilia endophytica]|uniref:TonB-dependent receptor n=1 Tax=Massilia endophytica TaxID=2899220 RepID=UPI001E5F399F|nr:TonB-dependent receptor [Massilia endophytica]UGQ46720.1 TonB-dependent receptor [Massilia endophytica]